MPPVPATETMGASERPRMIAGFGRSGTTWVQDVLAISNSLRPVFEPLHPTGVPHARDLAQRYMGTADDDQALYRLFHRYFFEPYHSLWVDYRQLRDPLIPRLSRFTSLEQFKLLVGNYALARDNLLRYYPQRHRKERLLKCVRANMMLSWLRRRFNARVVFMIRHPAAVVASQMGARFAWNPYDSIARYQADERLLDALDGRFRRLLFASNEDVEAYTLTWCIENSVALTQAREFGMPVVFYENLIRLGAPEWRRVLAGLDLKVMPDDAIVSQPSQQAWGAKATDPALVRQHDAWMQRTDRATSARIQRVLDATGMELYRVDGAFPAAWTSARTPIEGL